MFTGGAFSKASVFALGIMPYISASIVVQLMGIAIPYLQKLQSDGESGRKKNQSDYPLVNYWYHLSTRARLTSTIFTEHYQVMPFC